MEYFSFGTNQRLLTGNVVTERSLALIAGIVAVEVGVMVKVAVGLGVTVAVKVGVKVGIGVGVFVLVLVGTGVSVDVGVGAAKLLQPDRKIVTNIKNFIKFEMGNFIIILEEKCISG